jgi:tRNA G10  N-methylase Trm11
MEQTVKDIFNLTQLYEKLFDQVEERRNLLKKLVDLRINTEQAKDKFRRTGKRADPRWFAQVQEDIKQTEKEALELANEIHDTRKLVNSLIRNEHCFREAAKTMLDRETFEKVDDKAREYFETNRLEGDHNEAEARSLASIDN